MADYVIRCTDQTPAGTDHDSAHIERVAFEGATTCYTVAQVYALIDAGHRIWSRGPLASVSARVRKFRCRCGRATLRSDADATKVNNLDSLPMCGCR